MRTETDPVTGTQAGAARRIADGGALARIAGRRGAGVPGAGRVTGDLLPPSEDGSRAPAAPSHARPGPVRGRTRSRAAPASPRRGYRRARSRAGSQTRVVCVERSRTKRAGAGKICSDGPRPLTGWSEDMAGSGASPGTGTRSDSCTEPQSPSLFLRRSGSTRRPRLRQPGLLSKFRPPLSQCR